jgi:hypothetical protein
VYNFDNRHYTFALPNWHELARICAKFENNLLQIFNNLLAHQEIEKNEKISD